MLFIKMPIQSFKTLLNAIYRDASCRLKADGYSQIYFAQSGIKLVSIEIQSRFSLFLPRELCSLYELGDIEAEPYILNVFEISKFLNLCEHSSQGPSVLEIQSSSRSGIDFR